jgi:glycosyltransferase involved in cell wall biosynthesis
MNVLHIISGGKYFGGIETFLITLAKFKEFYPNTKISFSLFFDGILAKELRASGATVNIFNEVRISRLWTVLKARLTLKKILKIESIDIVAFHSFWELFILGRAVRSCRIPLVFFQHDNSSAKHNWLEYWAMKVSPDLVIANSNHVREGMQKIYPKLTIKTIYLPVKSENIEKLPQIRQAYRSEFNIALDKVVIIQSSRLEERKGHKLLISALGKIKELDNWECWIAGGVQAPSEQDYLNELHDLANSLGISSCIKFIGHRSDIPQLLAAVDIMCQPNTGTPEPFGIAFVEALYAGLPVVTTAMGGALEIVNESCGILVPVDNVNELSDALRTLIIDSEKRARLGGSGYNRAKEICDPITQINQIYDLISDIIKK